jgi:hypothetical protein
MNFSDLNFIRHDMMKGIQALHFFPNGYGVSVVRGKYSHGGSQGLYELAVIQGNQTKWKLCYDTEVTCDVIGYLNEHAVEKIMSDVEAL